MVINLSYVNSTENYFSQLIFSIQVALFLFRNSTTLHYQLQEYLLLGNELSIKLIH